MVLGRVSLLVVQGHLSTASYERLQHDVRCVGQDMNSLQSAFLYSFYEHDPLKDVEPAKAGHSLDEYYGGLGTFHTANVKENYCIVVSSGVLEEEAWFNHHRDDFGVITVREFERWVPPGTSRQQYLMYLILCESVLVHCKGFVEHPIPEACLFDACNEQTELIAGLRRPQIHKECRTTLAQTYMIPTDELAGFDRVLKRVRRRDLHAILASQTSASARSFWLGIGAAFVGSVITSESLRAGVAISWVIFVTVFFWWLAGRTREWKLVERHPTWARRVALVVFGVLLAVGVALSLWVGSGTNPKPTKGQPTGSTSTTVH